MYSKFLKYIKDESLFEKSDKLLIGVSGGVDSVVLAEMVNKYGNEFVDKTKNQSRFPFDKAKTIKDLGKNENSLSENIFYKEVSGKRLSDVGIQRKKGKVKREKIIVKPWF